MPSTRRHPTHTTQLLHQLTMPTPTTP
jgi:hypothetical protein